MPTRSCWAACLPLAAIIVAANLLFLLIYDVAFSNAVVGYCRGCQGDGASMDTYRRPRPVLPSPDPSPARGVIANAPKEDNSNGARPKEDKDMASFCQLMAERKRVLDDGCEAMRDSGPEASPRNSRNVLVMPEKELLWCPIFKASSSTWLSFLLDISDMSQRRKARLYKEHWPHQPLKLVEPMTNRYPMKVLKDYVDQHRANLTSFLIVRHPFNRLVSAFRDKLERSRQTDVSEDWYFRTYGAIIVAKYRQDAVRRFGEAFFSAENNFGAPLPVQGHRQARQPSFWEFVQYVKRSPINRMDEHWRPMSSWCSPCLVPYANVIKFERLEEEGRHLKRLIDAEKSQKEEKWANPNLTGMKLEDLTKTYFSMLTKEDVDALYKIYEWDFRLFDYTFQFDGHTYPSPAA